jgi:hypothetical protein
MKSYHVNSGAGIAGLAVREHDKPKPGHAKCSFESELAPSTFANG